MQGRATVRPGRVIDTSRHPLAAGHPPPWASGWGQDQYGVWVAFMLGEATQRLRWIPPGRFTMGSPNDEPGRSNAEGPLHDVTLEKGFWLFDTPCTQALWAEVTGTNPSRFVHPARPVERVSFEDVGTFLARLNAAVPGLDLALPSEAQWEYACRAGTRTATYAGAMRILGDNHAPVLDKIAWYGGNSGKDFDLPDGEESSGWPGKQYAHTKAGTRVVAGKRPNAWGLHDMLGNVWEWCADTWHDDYVGAPADGSAWIDAARSGSASRVVRGGSWLYEARLVRTAFRSPPAPADRGSNLGFRCARVQSDF